MEIRWRNSGDWRLEIRDWSKPQKASIMTNAELAILSLVAEQPRYGYEIEQVIEERGMREWTDVGFSSIYYLLKKLEREGLVVGQLEEAERGPARKVYHITQAGREAQRAGVLDALSVPRQQQVELGLRCVPLRRHGQHVGLCCAYLVGVSAVQ